MEERTLIECISKWGKSWLILRFFSKAEWGKNKSVVVEF